jgi:hypothetical protein
MSQAENMLGMSTGQKRSHCGWSRVVVRSLVEGILIYLEGAWSQGIAATDLTGLLKIVRTLTFTLSKTGKKQETV